MRPPKEVANCPLLGERVAFWCQGIPCAVFLSHSLVWMALRVLGQATAPSWEWNLRPIQSLGQPAACSL